ncbi:MAG: sugar nucleotide-binding protein [Candidatus Omnitrophica bacterium]|nr:sugar nucleotide-binding protein [Candidatus Omnitrophota bacterium]
MKSRILILGRGFIGERLQEALNCDISECKIHSFKDAELEIKKHNPKILINCIGHTGKINVDGCELDKDKTLSANTFIPIILAEVALRNRIKLVHISSGCIYRFDYSKDRPIKEEEISLFFDLFYSRSKIYSERTLEVLSRKFDILIPRIRIPLDNRPHPKNILTKLINYKRVIDIPNSITYIPDFIKALKHLLKINAKGIYNVVNKGGLRYPQLLDVYKKYIPDFKYKIIDYKRLNLVRTNLILSTKKLEKTGFKVRNIKDALEECVRDYLNTD